MIIGKLNLENDGIESDGSVDIASLSNSSPILGRFGGGDYEDEDGVMVMVMVMMMVVICLWRNRIRSVVLGEWGGLGSCHLTSLTCPTKKKTQLALPDVHQSVLSATGALSYISAGAWIASRHSYTTSWFAVRRKINGTTWKLR